VALEDLAEPAAATHLFGEELFALVILDLSAFPSSDAVPPLAPSEPARLLHLLDRDAVVLLGPLDFTEEGLVGLGAWAAAASEYPARRLHVRGGEGVLALFRSASSSSWSLERPLAVWDETGAEAVEPEPAGAGPAGNVTERAGGSVPEPASSSDPPVSGPGSVDLPRSTVGTEQ
jgi:hypothetical protein